MAMASAMANAVAEPPSMPTLSLGNVVGFGTSSGPFQRIRDVVKVKVKGPAAERLAVAPVVHRFQLR